MTGTCSKKGKLRTDPKHIENLCHSAAQGPGI